METFTQQVVDGIAWGGLYGALALSLVLVHRASATVNFAQGEMAMFAAYLAWQVHAWGLPLGWAILVSMAVAFAAGALIERTLVRPLASTRTPLPVIIVTLGLMLILNSAAGWIWGYNARAFPTLWAPRIVHVGPVAVSGQTLVVIAAVILLAGLLYLLSEHTGLGLAMRAAVANPDSARLLGLPVDRIASMGWGLAAAAGALVGCLAAPQLFLQPNMFLSSLIYAFAAAILGGIDSPLGALIGGLVVGISENLAGAYVPWIGADFKQAVALVIIVGVLTLRPQGIFGARAVVRV